MQIVATMVSLADALELDVVAEGVEVEPQFALLSKMYCHQIQGYYFARPLKPQDFNPYFLEKSFAADFQHNLRLLEA